MPEFTIIGHRGACAHEPENTLRSIKRAITDGAPMVEIDVRLAGGEVIVIHDETLDRTTNGKGSVYDKTFPQLRELDAGRGEKIPTLAEVIALTLPETLLNIEIKDTEVTAPICELLQNNAEIDRSRIVISSFHEKATRETRRKLPGIPIGILASNKPQAVETMFALASELRAFSVHPAVDSTTSELVEKAHQSGYRVLPYTTRTEKQLASVIAAGADGCFADDPKWAAEFWFAYEK